ncbi:MAG: c-type cytochrome [Sphingobacteriales bacterium]|nr:MAG: c-type cytochrome [Sphingobacteriales bacterium]
MRTRSKRFIPIAAIMMFAPAMLHAAEATAPASKDGESFNALLVGLVALVVALLFAIGLLGNVLRQLASAYQDKMRSDRLKAAGVIKVVLFLVATSLPSLQTFAQEAAPAAEEVVAEVVSPYISGIPRFDFYVLMGIITLELVVVIFLLLMVRLMVKLISEKPELAPILKQVKLPLWDRLNNTVPLEKEQDIMLGHNYDGIQELDNSLPPWWKYGFYLTIVVSFVYIWYYHAGGNGPSQYDEYVAEVKKGDAEKAAYLARSANNVDETTVKMGDAMTIASGMNLFQSSCAACHAKDGGGGVGPNLTDDYWLHGGSIQDVFKSVKYGWSDKGMKSWKDDFSPKQIADIASYIKSIKGTAPAAPKEKQGELYVEGTPTAGADSTKKVAMN